MPVAAFREADAQTCNHLCVLSILAIFYGFQRHRWPETDLPEGLQQPRGARRKERGSACSLSVFSADRVLLAKDGPYTPACLFGKIIFLGGLLRQARPPKNI